MPHLWMFLLQSLTPPGHEVLLIDGNAQPMDEDGEMCQKFFGAISRTYRLDALSSGTRQFDAKGHDQRVRYIAGPCNHSSVFRYANLGPGHHLECANFCAHPSDRWAQLRTASHMLQTLLSCCFSSAALKTGGLFRVVRLPWAQEAGCTEYSRWSLQFSGKQVMRAVSDMPQSEKETQCARVVSELPTIHSECGGRERHFYV